MLGGTSISSAPFSITVTESYAVDSNTGVYTQLLVPVSSSLSGNSCTNVLREIHYDIALNLVQADQETSYQITSISAKVVVQSNPLVALANGMAGISQKYSVSYSTGNASQAKSGNPGYIPGFPLLLGS